MKKELSVLEIRQLADEFQLLANGRIDKVYQTSKKEFIFKIHVTGGSRFLKLADKFILLTPEKGSIPERPTTFCTILRKNLENRRIKSIAQRDSERIMVIETESNVLVIELFGQTNLILCDRNYSVVSANRTDKELRKGQIYHFPEPKPDIFRMAEAEFIDAMKSSKTEAVKTIASFIGGTYAEEVCLRAGISKSLKSPEETDAKALYKSFSSLIGGELSPMVIYDEKGAFDAVIYDLQLYGCRNKVAFSSFYEAVESYLSQTSELKRESEAEKKYSSQMEKAEKIMELQRKTIEKLSREREQIQRAGELIYEKYGEVEKILGDAKNGIVNRKIISVDKKEKKITIEL